MNDHEAVTRCIERALHEIDRQKQELGPRPALSPGFHDAVYPSSNRTIARERGRKTYAGLTCAVDPSHGNQKVTSSGRCVECEKKRKR